MNTTAGENIGEGVGGGGGVGRIDRKKWLHENKLTDVEHIFEERDVAIEELTEFDQEELNEFAKDIGLDTLQRRRFVKAILALVANGVARRSKPISSNNLGQTSQQGEPNTSVVSSSSSSSAFSSNKLNQNQLIHVIVSPQEHEAITKVYDRCNRTKQLLAELEKSMTILDDRKSQCKEQITNQMLKLIQQLENKKSQLLNEINVVKVEKKNKLQKQLNDLNNYRQIIAEGRQRYEELIGDASLEVHVRRKKVLQLVNGILEDKPSMVMVTQPNVKFTHDKSLLNKFLTEIMIDDCDQPGSPTVTLVKVTHNIAQVDWTMSNKDLQKPILAFAIELAYVKLLEKNKRRKRESKKRGKGKEKDRKRKKKKDSDDSDESSSTASSEEEEEEESEVSSDESKSDEEASESSSSDKDKEDEDEDEDEQEDNDDKEKSSSSGNESDRKEKEKVSSSFRAKKKGKSINEEKISQEYIVEKSEEGVDVVDDKDAKIKLDWEKYQILSGERFEKNQFSWVVKKLKANALYYLRIRAQNTSGWGMYSYPATEIITKECQMDTKILKEKEKTTLMKWVAKGSRQRKWKLLFRASKDGFDSGAFHRKCDNKGPTVTIIHSNLGNVFGGYTAVPWTTAGAYRSDNDAFIFLLRSVRGQKGKYTCKNSTNSVYHHGSYGPTFGGGFDFYLCTNCNSTNSSYSNAGYSYNCASDQTLLAGAYNFTVKDYEVFSVK